MALYGNHIQVKNRNNYCMHVSCFPESASKLSYVFRNFFVIVSYIFLMIFLESHFFVKFIYIYIYIYDCFLPNIFVGSSYELFTVSPVVQLLTGAGSGWPHSALCARLLTDASRLPVPRLDWSRVYQAPVTVLRVSLCWRRV